MATAKRLFNLLVLCWALVLTAWLGHAWWRDHVRPFESTDNAYVRAHMARISPRIGGYVKTVRFEDNQAVAAGTLLVEVDDAPLRAERARVEAEVAAQDRRRDALLAEREVQNARIAQHVAAYGAALANFQRAQKDLARLSGLVEDGSVPAQQRDAAEQALAVAKASLAEHRARTEEATRQRAALAAQVEEALAARAVASAALARLDVDLAQTRITAPFAGVLGNRAVQVGQLVQPGAVLAYLVPQGEFFVEANFKETQLAEMQVGQTAEVRVDAYPERAFSGVVDSTAPASGAEFSILPPENATGNFTKIVRRVPVKIRFDAGLDLAALKPGLSTEVKVRVR